MNVRLVLMMLFILVQLAGCGAGGESGPAYTLCGTQSDAAGNPVSGAVVSLVVNSKVYKTGTNASGEYSLTIPPSDAAYLPSSFTYTVSKTGYVPLTYTRVRTDTVCQGSLPLMAADYSSISVEADPLPHHLGNNNFSGAINSKFQYPNAEGTSFTRQFDLTTQPLDYASATITFVHKGVESPSFPNQLVLNGQSWQIPSSDPSGEYTEFSLTVPTSIFTANGPNTVTIMSGAVGLDYDDFEFQNIGIKFAH